MVAGGFSRALRGFAARMHADISPPTQLMLLASLLTPRPPLLPHWSLEPAVLHLPASPRQPVGHPSRRRRVAARTTQLTSAERRAQPPSLVVDLEGRVQVVVNVDGA